MTKTEVPAPKFGRFERVRVSTDRTDMEQFDRSNGTVVWFESQGLTHGRTRREWLYVVHLPSSESYPTFWESELHSEGSFDSELTHRGVRPEVSFDTILDHHDNAYVEGAYRLPGEFWKVMIFARTDEKQLSFAPSKWDRATEWEGTIDGIVFRFPKRDILNQESMVDALRLAFGYHDWAVVRGPDSMMLR